MSTEIAFDLPKEQSSKIKIIGVGGGGCNALSYIVEQGVTGVDFIACNTDEQHLIKMNVSNKILMGKQLTGGLGAGMKPEKGREAAEESKDDIQKMLERNTEMLFITACMGGGTGTGAAPVIAEQARKMGILTVAFVTMPFSYEGRSKTNYALEGLDRIKKHVDSLVVINNDKLTQIYPDMASSSAYQAVDEMLCTAARTIVEVISTHYRMNIDLKDAETVLKDSGTAIMGAATASGEDRHVKALNQALDFPLLESANIRGAKSALVLVTSGPEGEVTVSEKAYIFNTLQEIAGGDVDIIPGEGSDPSLGNAIKISIIATGFTEERRDEANTIRPIITRERHQISSDIDEDVFETKDMPVRNSPNQDRPELSSNFGKSLNNTTTPTSFTDLGETNEGSNAKIIRPNLDGDLPTNQFENSKTVEVKETKPEVESKMTISDKAITTDPGAFQFQVKQRLHKPDPKDIFRDDTTFDRPLPTSDRELVNIGGKMITHGAADLSSDEKITAIEDKPAYLRQGVNISDVSSGGISSTRVNKDGSLSKEQGNEKGNSFLNRTVD